MKLSKIGRFEIVARIILPVLTLLVAVGMTGCAAIPLHKLPIQKLEVKPPQNAPRAVVSVFFIGSFGDIDQDKISNHIIDAIKSTGVVVIDPDDKTQKPDIRLEISVAISTDERKEGNLLNGFLDYHKDTYDVSLTVKRLDGTQRYTTRNQDVVGVWTGWFTLPAAPVLPERRAVETCLDGQIESALYQAYQAGALALPAPS